MPRAILYVISNVLRILSHKFNRRLVVVLRAGSRLNALPGTYRAAVRPSDNRNNTPTLCYSLLDGQILRSERPARETPRRGACEISSLPVQIRESARRHGRELGSV